MWSPEGTARDWLAFEAKGPPINKTPSSRIVVIAIVRDAALGAEQLPRIADNKRPSGKRKFDYWFTTVIR